MKHEFIEKILKAKEYEAKAFASLLPDSVRPHMKAIQKELAAMVLDIAVREKKEQKSGGDNDRKNVHKVDIQ